MRTKTQWIEFIESIRKASEPLRSQQFTEVWKIVRRPVDWRLRRTVDPEYWEDATAAYLEELWRAVLKCDLVARRIPHPVGYFIRAALNGVAKYSGQRARLKGLPGPVIYDPRGPLDNSIAFRRAWSDLPDPEALAVAAALVGAPQLPRSTYDRDLMHGKAAMIEVLSADAY